MKVNRLLEKRINPLLPTCICRHETGMRTKNLNSHDHARSNSPALWMEANTVNSYSSMNILTFTRRKNSFAGNSFPCKRIRHQCCPPWPSITSHHLQSPGRMEDFKNWLKVPIQESGSFLLSFSQMLCNKSQVRFL